MKIDEQIAKLKGLEGDPAMSVEVQKVSRIYFVSLGQTFKFFILWKNKFFLAI